MHSTCTSYVLNAYLYCVYALVGGAITGVLKISLAGANNSVPTTGLTPCIIIIHVYTCNYSGAGENIDAR